MPPTVAHRLNRPAPCSSYRVVAAAQKQGSGAAVASSSTSDIKYFNVTGYPFPLGPFTERRTIRREARGGACPSSICRRCIRSCCGSHCAKATSRSGPLHSTRTLPAPPPLQVEKGCIWVFEQPQSLGFSNVTTNCRMTVIKLKSGGLWVHAPIAPTRECLRLLQVQNWPCCACCAAACAAGPAWPGLPSGAPHHSLTPCPAFCSAGAGSPRGVHCAADLCV